MSYADMVARSGALQSSFTAVARDPEAGRRRGHRLRPRRRLRAGAVRRLPGRAATTPSSASRRSSSASSPAPAAPSGCRGWSARRGPRTSSSPAGSSAPRRRCAIGLVDQVVPADEVYAAAVRAGQAVRRRPGARAARGQGGDRRAASRPTSTPASSSSGCSSPGCSPPTTGGPAWSRSSRTAPARPRSPAGDQRDEHAEPEPDRCRGRARLDGRQAGQRALPRLGGARPTTRSGRSPTTSGASTTPATGSPPSRARDGWPYAEALELGSGTGFFLLNLMQAGVATTRPRHRPVARHGRGRGAQRHRPRARRRRPGRRRRVDPVRRRDVRPRGRARRPAPHPRRRARAARGAARAQARRPVRVRRRADDRRATGTPAASAGSPGRPRRRSPAWRRCATRWSRPRGGARRVVAGRSAGVGRRHPHLRPAATSPRRRCGPARSTCARRPRS